MWVLLCAESAHFEGATQHGIDDPTAGRYEHSRSGEAVAAAVAARARAASSRSTDPGPTTARWERRTSAAATSCSRCLVTTQTMGWYPKSSRFSDTNPWPCAVFLLDDGEKGVSVLGASADLAPIDPGAFHVPGDLLDVGGLVVHDFVDEFLGQLVVRGRCDGPVR